MTFVGPLGYVNLNARNPVVHGHWSYGAAEMVSRKTRADGPAIITSAKSPDERDVMGHTG
jgi:hypothetical protein